MSNIFGMTDTWNNGLTVFSAIKMNVTDTASDPTSLLMDLQLGGVSKDKTDKLGNKTISGSLSFLGDTFLARDAANTLALRNGVNGQTFNVYNTYTDASNYERGYAGWAGVVFSIGTQSGGTGSARSLQLVSSSNIVICAGNLAPSNDANWDLGGQYNRWNNFQFGGNYIQTPTWNAAGTTFTAIKANITDTASNVASLLMDLQVGGVSQLSVGKSGVIRTRSLTVATLPAAATALAGAISFVTDSSVVASGNFGAIVAGAGANGVPVYSDGTNWRIG